MRVLHFGGAVMADTAFDRIVFHFNKASLSDPEIPPWVLKTRGQTHYAWHVEADVPFSTKETPGNAHTQGAIQFRGGLRLHTVAGRQHATITRGAS
jgi:hypothetical protein